MTPPDDERRPLKYRRIADDLRAGIRAGEYSPGRPLPGENDLMARYQVARMTVRQALAELQREGLAVARRGSGVYVSEFRPIVREQGGETAEQALQADDVQVSRTAAPEAVALALGLAADDPVWVRSQRLLLDRGPVMLSVSWLPAALVEGSPLTSPDPGPGGTYARLADLGHAPTRFREEVRARPASPEEAERLDLAAGAPVIALTRQAYAGELPVELTEMVLDASVYVLRYDFGADVTAPA